VHIRDLGGEFDPVEAQYMRVRASSFGPMPAWHPGAGGDSFIFIDELLVDAVPVERESGS
jgi:hypothetical protein